MVGENHLKLSIFKQLQIRDAGAFAVSVALVRERLDALVAERIVSVAA